MAPALLATAACGTRQRQRDQGHDHAAVRLLRRAQSDQTSPASDGSGLCPAVAAGAALMYSPPRRGGVDATSIKFREATVDGAGGVVSAASMPGLAGLTTPSAPL